MYRTQNIFVFLLVHINGADFGSSFSKLNTLMDMGRERSPKQWQGFHANCQLVTTIKQVDGYLAIWLSIGGASGNAHACQPS